MTGMFLLKFPKSMTEKYYRNRI